MEQKNNKGIKKLVTHDGSFHSDDVFACASLSLLLEGRGEEFQVIRTRDPLVIKEADIVFDVGGEYDSSKNKFDHHQPGGAGKRENGIEYSSFGLVWKQFGEEVSGSVETRDMLDKHLVSAVDAFDNGIEIIERKGGTSPYLIQHFFFAMTPTWQEDDLEYDEMFRKSVSLAKEVLKREISHT